MSDYLFKRLFEVKLLHDYYLISSDGGSYFEKSKEVKEEVIESKIKHRMYNVEDFLEIEPTEVTKKWLRDFKFIYRKTALGFLLGIQVKEEIKLGAKVYKPRFKMPNSLNLTFEIKILEAQFLSMTNINMRPFFPAIYYFTNKGKQVFNETGPGPNYKTLPISVVAGKYQNGMHYEMGNLVKWGTGLREALEFTNVNSSDLNFWGKLKDKRFVTNADRILLPTTFNYPIKVEQNITQLKVVLEDLDANEIKLIAKSNGEPLRNVPLNFAMVDETIENPVPIPSGFYRLKVQENGGPIITYSVYLNDNLYNKNKLGIIDIRLDELDSPFSLLDADGYLKTRIENTGEFKPHLVYELRFKNRKTYWRYNKEANFEASDVTIDLNPYVAFEPNTKKIISKKPKGLTRSLVPFKSGTNEKILPYPKIPALKVEGKRMYSEIYINKSNKLIHS